MEEEEEVDIVGGEDGAYMSRNEREISCISSGQMLTCDYTVHPQWLADNADATVHWSVDQFPKQSSQDEMEMVQDEVVIEEPAPIDFAWCEEVSECDGHAADMIILDQDIPTTQEEEVFTNSGTEAEDDAQSSGRCSSVMSPQMLLQPAPPPQPIVYTTTVSTYQPIAHPELQQRIRTVSVSSAHPRSLLKRNLLAAPKFRQTLLVNRSILKPPDPHQHPQQLQPQHKQQHGAVIPAPIVKRILQASASKVAPNTTSVHTTTSTVPQSRSIITSISSTITAKPSTEPSIQTPQKPVFAKIQRQSQVPSSRPSTSPAPTPPEPPVVRKTIPTTIRIAPTTAPKFRQTIRVPNADVFQNKRMRQLSKQLRLRTQGSGGTSRKQPADNSTTDDCDYVATGVTSVGGSKRGSSGKGGKIGGSNSSGGKRGQKFVSLHGENITINHDVESGSLPDATSAQMRPALPDLRPPKPHTSYASQSDGDDTDDTDVDIDIESDSSASLSPTRSPKHTVVHIDFKSSRQLPHTSGIGSTSADSRQLQSSCTAATQHNPVSHSHYGIQHPTGTSTVQPPELAAALNSLGVPDAAIDIDQSHISALEKHFHHEFFESRPTKTPERFMKIRNYIIKAWQDARPTYVSKTAVRQGLRHCGDVNCISRIHSLLEQIGAINFGCEQLQYVRPLRELGEMFAQPQRPKHYLAAGGALSSLAEGQEDTGGAPLFPERRQRTVKAADCSPDAIDANYTVSHEDGRILLPRNNVVAPTAASVSSTSAIQQPQRLSDSSDEDTADGAGGDPALAGNKRPMRHKKTVGVRPEFRLIECMRFNRRDRPAPFRVSITMSTLMCLQLHSLSARHEVMGFLGGHRERGADGLVTLRLNRYKPCQTSAQSSTMCEMCPVSQVEQSANLIADGYDILGWFHSHPAFPPNPSRTDVATQANMQLQFSFDQNRPFIGFILGCLDMKFKCVYVLPADVLNVSERTVPYELDVEIVKDCSNFSREIADVFDVIKANCDDYSLVLKKFTSYAKVFLQRHGYGKDVLAGLNDIMT